MIIIYFASLEPIFSFLYLVLEIESYNRPSYTDLLVICHEIFRTENIKVNAHECADYFKRLAATGCVVGGVNLFVCILLIIGIYKSKYILTWPYPIAKGIGFLLLAILPEARSYLSDWAFTGYIGRIFVITAFIGGILSVAIVLLQVIRALWNKKENQHTPAVSVTQNTREECTVTFKSPPTLETDSSSKSPPSLETDSSFKSSPTFETDSSSKSPPILETDSSFKSSPTVGANFSSDVCSVTMDLDDIS